MQLIFKGDNNKVYKVDSIQDNAVYARELVA